KQQTKKRLRLYNARPEDIVQQTAFDRYLQSKGVMADTLIKLKMNEAINRELLAEDSAFPKIPPKQYTYSTEFQISEATTQLGFDFLTASYQVYSGGNGPIYLNPSLTAITKIGISDLMENHRIIGGFGIGVDLTSTEFMVSYENLERRLSHQIVLHLANTTDYTDVYNATRNQSYNAHYILKYPLTPANLIRGSVFGRLDRIVYKGTSPITLEKKDSYVLRLGLRGEWVYDHSRTIMPNIYNGTRAKAWIEYYQGVFGKKDNLFVVGFDARYYHKIYRTFIWASRFATSTSFGQSKLIYYMGGVDSWMMAKFNREMKVNDKMQYAYQTLATNMRGFAQNIRNGNTFAVINTELRFPAFQVLSRTPVSSSFWRSFMIVAFVDVGSAWSGLNPFSKENTYYKKTIEDGPLTIELERNTSPFVVGFGAGLRAQLGGYSLRLDCAWGAADYMVSKNPSLYFSLATDF
ncbi:MAG: outer membrane protein assembly factor, partial [Bacteroidales bacterium]|nr:outer membrane protein assembly factor [Bacteroidales bacterium]